jgi:hypothetical protein
MGPAKDKKFAKVMQMGLGEAILRLMQIEHLRTKGIVAVPAQAAAERDLIVEALNTQRLDLGFDCDNDGVPDSVKIFAASAKTSCCRLAPIDSTKRTRSSSRRTTEE